MTITAKIGRRGQITVPKEVRERLEVKEGQRVAFVIRGNDVTLQPLKDTIFDHRGVVTVDGPQDFVAVRQAVLSKRAKKAEKDE